LHFALLCDFFSGVNTEISQTQEDTDMTVMKLTIEGDAATLSRVLAAIAGTTATHEPEPEVIPSPAVLAAVLVEDDVDVTGAQWDEAIHSSNRAKNKDGTWRIRRGANLEIVAPPLPEYNPVITPAPLLVTDLMQGAPDTVVQAKVAPAGPVVGVPPMPVGDEPIAAPVVEVKTMADFMQIYVPASKRGAERGTPINMVEFFGRIGQSFGLDLKGPFDVNKFEPALQEQIFLCGVELIKQDGLYQ
jgi:hypothetical protein